MSHLRRHPMTDRDVFYLGYPQVVLGSAGDGDNADAENVLRALGEQGKLLYWIWHFTRWGNAYQAHTDSYLYRVWPPASAKNPLWLLYIRLPFRISCMVPGMQVYDIYIPCRTLAEALQISQYYADNGALPEEILQRKEEYAQIVSRARHRALKQTARRIHPHRSRRS